MSRPVFRFAPSPNGLLHLGHAYSALLNYRLAQRLGGRFLLRIEDIDTQRCTNDLVEAMIEDLTWLGLSWELPPRRQSEHFSDYSSALERLRACDLLYPSVASRAEIEAAVQEEERESNAPWPKDPDGAPLYPRSALPKHSQSSQSAQMAMRLDMARARCMASDLVWWEFEPTTGSVRTIQADPERWGDVVLKRKDVPTSYHLSVVVDDALQGVTHVVRGLDLFHATSVHRLLQELLGLPEPIYHHHRLILGPDGRKLSKSLGDTALSALRAEGKTPSDIRAMVGI